MNMYKLMFVVATAISLQVMIAVAIVMEWGWLALFLYAFIGFFINLAAVRYNILGGIKLIP